MIIINFKNYKHGREVLDLAKKIQKVNKKVIVAVPTVNIEEVARKTKLDVYAQHFDSTENDKTTGFNDIQSIKSAKVKGTLLNHSEHPISFKEIKERVNLCKKYKIKSIVCSSNLREIKKII